MRTRRSTNAVNYNESDIGDTPTSARKKRGRPKQNKADVSSEDIGLNDSQSIEVDENISLNIQNEEGEEKSNENGQKSLSNILNVEQSNDTQINQSIDETFQTITHLQTNEIVETFNSDNTINVTHSTNVLEKAVIIHSENEIQDDELSFNNSANMVITNHETIATKISPIRNSTQETNEENFTQDILTESKNKNSPSPQKETPTSGNKFFDEQIPGEEQFQPHFDEPDDFNDLQTMVDDNEANSLEEPKNIVSNTSQLPSASKTSSHSQTKTENSTKQQNNNVIILKGTTPHTIHNVTNENLSEKNQVEIRSAPQTAILHIYNLVIWYGLRNNFLTCKKVKVRPFTLRQLKEEFEKYGPFEDTVDGFWIDKIKSHCIVKFLEMESAIKAYDALNNQKWPSSNPKLLRIEYTDQQELDYFKNSTAILERSSNASDIHSRPHTTELESGEISRSTSLKSGMDISEYHLLKNLEPLLPPGTANAATHRRVVITKEGNLAPSDNFSGTGMTEQEWLKMRREERERLVQMEQDARQRIMGVGKESQEITNDINKDELADKTTNKPSQVMDTLFQKTVSSLPSIYWLPLSEKQADEKMADLEKNHPSRLFISVRDAERYQARYQDYISVLRQLAREREEMHKLHNHQNQNQEKSMDSKKQHSNNTTTHSNPQNRDRNTDQHNSAGVGEKRKTYNNLQGSNDRKYDSSRDIGNENKGIRTTEHINTNDNRYSRQQKPTDAQNLVMSQHNRKPQPHSLDQNSKFDNSNSLSLRKDRYATLVDRHHTAQGNEHTSHHKSAINGGHELSKNTFEPYRKPIQSSDKTRVSPVYRGRSPLPKRRMVSPVGNRRRY